MEVLDPPLCKAGNFGDLANSVKIAKLKIRQYRQFAKFNACHIFLLWYTVYKLCVDFIESALFI